MNPTVCNSLKSGDPIFMIEIIKKMVVNCLNFRQSLQKIKFRPKEQDKAADSKDFLMIIDDLEFKLKSLQKVKKSESIFFTILSEERKRLKQNFTSR